MHIFEPTRAAALAQLADFVPRAGRAYAHGRNTDFGTGRHTAVSTLSPYTRRRLLTEQEIVEKVIAAHGREEADRFIMEVFWRTYFKGWLERRPLVWDHYRTTRDALMPEWRKNLQLHAAQRGRTGIGPFDEWVHELVGTGYLHNHARMWFASIWIFTLRLPWQLGADFFLRHLLDGDPASNTLSWRWVAGLHTRGKHYLAQRTNIDRFTRNRALVEAGRLNEEALPLEEDFDPGPALPLRTPRAPDPALRSALLLTPEDCHPESIALPDTVATASLHIDGRSPVETAQAVRDFDDAALADTAARLGVASTPVHSTETLVTWVKETGATQIVTPFVPRGPVHDWLTAAAPVLDAEGVAVAEVRRDWDERIWPRATAGFFKVKKAIPDSLNSLKIE